MSLHKMKIVFKMGRLKLALLISLLFLYPFTITFAQNNSSKQKIAVFVPLYLDSAFDATNTYRYDKNFPKFINPGLEFYEGVQFAIDSLNKENAQLEVFVYDTRSVQRNLLEQINEIDSTVGLIIAHANAQENWVLAGEAMLRKIPYINVNLPNDGGIVNNPYFVMLNPSLRTHVESMYRYLQKYYSVGTTTVLRKKGQMEDLIKSYLEDYSKSTTTVPLRLKWVELTDSFTIKQLLPLLDSNRQNTFVAASLDDNFNRRLITQLALAGRSYKTSIIGMPTMDNLDKEFSRAEFKGPEIIYGLPFYNAKTDKISAEINNHFSTKMYARPSDMVFRGYEVMWKYSKLLAQYKSDLSSNLNNKSNKVFTDFDIQPVLNKQTMTMEYFENKKLYFIKWQDGVIKGVN
ncbi:MAG: amino acid ABC transporter substrate-binding protein [Bacteroidetes bacterium]|nr:MAG: amino acid ABC transporter substrate-binding protein [Bacteroidota bacterium]